MCQMPVTGEGKINGIGRYREGVRLRDAWWWCRDVTGKWDSWHGNCRGIYSYITGDVYGIVCFPRNDATCCR